ncbi:hypothetical protein [Pelagibacterium halotolerans]|uniref:hypothetical protein n=1 Tax=Pelagibacterium halotolerans TaxID=531813 RepID=UPI00384B3107
MAQKMTAAVFADAGETEHATLYRQAGETLGSRGVAVVVTAVAGRYPVQFVAGALGKGARVTLICAKADRPDGLPDSVAVELAEDARDAARLAAETADALIGLPGGLSTTAALYRAWADVGGPVSGKPVGLLNRKKAFEIVRGFISDVANPGLGSTDRLIVFADGVDDLIGRLKRLV